MSLAVMNSTSSNIGSWTVRRLLRKRHIDCKSGYFSIGMFAFDKILTIFHIIRHTSFYILRPFDKSSDFWQLSDAIWGLLCEIALSRHIWTLLIITFGRKKERKRGKTFRSAMKILSLHLEVSNQRPSASEPTPACEIYSDGHGWWGLAWMRSSLQSYLLTYLLITRWHRAY